MEKLSIMNGRKPVKIYQAVCGGMFLAVLCMTIPQFLEKSLTKSYGQFMAEFCMFSGFLLGVFLFIMSIATWARNKWYP